MIASDVLGPRADFSLAASDIDSKALAAAARRAHQMDGLKGLEPQCLQRCFMLGWGQPRYGPNQV